MDERQRGADLLKRFLDDQVQSYELDDFLSVPANDSHIEKVRVEVANIPNRYPAIEGSAYASDAGLQRIAELADELYSNSSL